MRTRNIKDRRTNSARERRLSKSAGRTFVGASLKRRQRKEWRAGRWKPISVQCGPRLVVGFVARRPARDFFVNARPMPVGYASPPRSLNRHYLRALGYAEIPF